MDDAEIIKVLIVDDHPLFRQGLTLVISHQPDMRIVGEANDGTEAVQKATSLDPNVIIMDMMMPNMNGVEAIKAILEKNPNIRILAFSGSEDDQTILSAIQAGATGYLPKQSPPAEVAKAVRNAYNGIPSIPADVAIGLMKNMKEEKRGVPFLEETLSPREIEILKQVALGHSNKEIADMFVLSEGTVRSHISHIIDKLNLNSRAQLLRFALQHGLDKA